MEKCSTAFCLGEMIQWNFHQDKTMVKEDLQTLAEFQCRDGGKQMSFSPERSRSCAPCA